MSERILVILGHPRKDSFCGALANAYADGASAKGKDVRFIALIDLDFDPVLRKGYREDADALEPDLVRAREAITWCEHLTIVYPTWWGSTPALLKGFFDRAFLPGFAFRFRESQLWDGLLKGRSGRIMVTMDAPPLLDRTEFSSSSRRSVAKATLGFCGVKPVHVSVFGSVKMSDAARRERWIAEARRKGRLD